MDGGRYVLQQAGWDNSSALEKYDAILDSDLRAGAAYGGRVGYLEGPFAQESSYTRESFAGDILYEKEILGVAPAVLELWPPAKRRIIEDDLAILQEVQRHDKVGFVDAFQYYGFDRVGRHSRDHDSCDGDDFEYRRRPFRGSREGSRDIDRDNDLNFSLRRGYDSDKERNHREKESWRRKDRDSDRNRGRDRDRGWSSRGREHYRDRSRSTSYEEHSRRPSSNQSHSRGRREDSIEAVPRYDTRSEKWRNQETRSGHHENATLVPSATLVVKGLSQKTVEDDLYHALADWGPLRHVRVIKERNSGVSRGFAFVDFPSTEAAKKMMDGVTHDSLVVDGRRLFFEYSKPTGGVGAPQMGSNRRGGCLKSNPVSGMDWMCTVCGCVNFARRTLCFQCNEEKAEDAPPADVPVSTTPLSGGRRISEAGPTHVLVVRGLDENVTEETLHYEFSKYAPIKDLRLVRDKFTHASRGFAFIHFNSVEEATEALESSNGTALEKNGQLLRVAFAKSIYGPGSSASGAAAATSQGSLAAAAAIEAASFALQYNSAGWAPKEYNPDQDVSYGNTVSPSLSTNGVGKGGHEKAPPQKTCQSRQEGAGFGANKSSSSERIDALQSGFVWDEASGYYYDAASGIYYDGHRGLYYDGNTGIWYTYDQESQQYTQLVDPSADSATNAGANLTKASTDRLGETKTEGNVTSKAVISAPAAVSLELVEKKVTLAEAVAAAAAAAAAQAVAKKEKDRMKDKEKETRLAGKGPVMVSKKKITNVMNQWKQRQFEGQVVQGSAFDSSSTLPAGNISEIASDISSSIGATTVGTTGFSRSRLDSLVWSLGRSGGSLCSGVGHPSEGKGSPKPVLTKNSSINSYSPPVSRSLVAAHCNTPAGVVQGMGRGARRAMSESGNPSNVSLSSEPVATTPYRTDVSALGSYGPLAGTKRRFSETPLAGYRDRAAERRNLYGSSLGDNSSDTDLKDKVLGVKGRGLDMPFPPGVGFKAGGNGSLEGQPFEVISAEKALDEGNVGNRILRSMGWQEGSGLGKAGTGIVEPVQAQGIGERAGLGSASQRKIDSCFETQPGDTYRIVIQKKALARFHEMI